MILQFTVFNTNDVALFVSAPILLDSFQRSYHFQIIEFKLLSYSVFGDGNYARYKLHWWLFYFKS